MTGIAFSCGHLCAADDVVDAVSDNDCSAALRALQTAAARARHPIIRYTSLLKVTG